MTQKSAIRIAVLEDNTDLQEELIFFLEAKGYRAWGQRSAEAFWKHLHAHPVDIVLIDVGLPGENGFSVLEYLRELGPHGRIVMSARGSQQDRRQGMELGADAYLVKPVNFTDLISTIDKLWQKLERDASHCKPPATPGDWAPSGNWLREPEAQQVTDELADRPRLEAVLRQRVLAFIQQNIHRPDLSPILITNRFNVSRSHLYRAFASDGGVAKVLRDKRLDAAIQELSRADGSTPSITELAHRLGFSSNNQFLRAFRNRFGITPSQAREKRPAPNPKSPAQSGLPPI
jgi:two-component system response regulator PhoP